MPYIRKDERERAKNYPRTPGELNFCLTAMSLDFMEGGYDPSQFSVEIIKTIEDYLEDMPRSYETFNSIMGVLDCVPREIGRRFNSDYQQRVENVRIEFEAQRSIFYLLTVAPYEDVKCEVNGDVFPAEMIYDTEADL